jgi:hypothetical protein
MSEQKEGPDESTRHAWWETQRGEARGEQCCCPGGLCCGGNVSGTPANGAICPGQKDAVGSTCTTDADCAALIGTCAITNCPFCDSGFEYRYVETATCFEASVCQVDGSYGCCL